MDSQAWMMLASLLCLFLAAEASWRARKRVSGAPRRARPIFRGYAPAESLGRGLHLRAKSLESRRHGGKENQRPLEPAPPSLLWLSGDRP